jgi:hypothetical protein
VHDFAIAAVLVPFAFVLGVLVVAGVARSVDLAFFHVVRRAHPSPGPGLDGCAAGHLS